ncbi:MAG: TrkA family potassium uptake protein [Eubacteriales bacterium]|nr:TrkA family potassium uptake protein [Eubacteriales bacterium]
MKKKQEAASFGIIGLGRFGTALAVTLAEAGKEVIAVDRDESKVKAIRQYTDYAFVAENVNADTLKEIGIQNCDVVAVCVGERIDASILITMCAIELGVPQVFSKASSPEQGAVLKKLGATVVYPERDMAIRLGKRLVSNTFLDYIALDNSVEIRQIQTPERMVGMSIQQVDFRKKYGLNIIAIEREETTTIEIAPDYRFRKGDVIVVIGKVDNIDRLERDS